MTEAATADEIVLRVPARAPYARIVRVGAAALALRQGMSFTDIDDVRLAIDEALILLLDSLHPAAQPEAGEGAEIACLFRIDKGSFEFEAKRTDEAGMQAGAIDRFDELARDLVDSYDLDPAKGWLRLRKLHDSGT